MPRTRSTGPPSPGVVMIPRTPVVKRRLRDESEASAVVKSPSTVKSPSPKPTTPGPVGVSQDGEDLLTSFILKPHTITVLLCVLALILYIAFFYPPADMQEAIKRGLAAMAFIFLVYCAIQFRDGLLIRPHPAVWRVITGCGLLYLMALTFLLQLKVEDARTAVNVLFPEAGVPLPERSYAAECALYNTTTHSWDFTTFRQTLVDEFIVAHLLGWYFSALMIRDWKLCMVLSLAFELVEISFQHWMENFKECWWDHVILDVLVCNTIGIFAGVWTSRYFEFREYNWMGVESLPRKQQSRTRRFLMQFLPLTWTKYYWGVFSSLSRLGSVTVALILYLWIKTNSFFVKFVLFIPPRSPFNTFRLILMWATSLPGVREYYEYVTNPSATHVGPNSWLSLATVITELLVVIKFGVKSTGGASLFARPFPPAVVLSWAAFALMFGGWAVAHFSLKHIVRSSYVRAGKAKPSWWRPVRRSLNVLRWASFLPLAYMFVAECPDLQWGRHYAERAWTALGFQVAA